MAKYIKIHGHYFDQSSADCWYQDVRHRLDRPENDSTVKQYPHDSEMDV